jgi:arsenate reductase
MAEGFAKAYLDLAQYKIYSAGTKKHGLNPNAVKVMKECGVDISSHFSKTVDEIPESKEINHVFTVCEDAYESCPYFPYGKVIHQAFRDPPRLTKDIKDEESILKIYREVRDEIKEFVMQIPNIIEEGKK